jgi:histidinol-phosphate aminotransferase
MKKLIRQSVEKMTGYTPGEQPTEKNVIKLNTNENPYPPSPEVERALITMNPSRLRLYPDPLSNKLREKIAGMHGCKISQVFACNGSDEVLALCTRAFVENSGSIGYFVPSYSLYPVLAKIRDVKEKPVELTEDFRWRMPKNYKCSLFFLTCPNAPTGILYPKNEISAFCRNFPGVVVIDEAYVDFSKENCMNLALTLNNVLVIRTVSKSFSLAGMRVGYAVGPERLIEALFKIKDSYNLDRVSQEVAFAAFSDLKHMRANVEKIKATRSRLTKSLSALGHQVYPSESNFLWVRPRGLTAKELFNRLRAKRILIRYFPGPRTGDFVRITIGTNAECDQLLTALKKLA